jgi:hypothetical protein
MSRALAIALVGFILVGCSTSAEVKNPFKANDTERTQLAAFAAQSQYPTRQPSDDLAVAALIKGKDGDIKILNTTERAITDAKVWVNGAYVAHVDNIPARGTVNIQRENLFNRDGISLAKANTAATRVQLEIGDKLYNVHGPAMEQ